MGARDAHEVLQTLHLWFIKPLSESNEAVLWMKSRSHSPALIWLPAIPVPSCRHATTHLTVTLLSDIYIYFQCFLFQLKDYSPF